MGNKHVMENIQRTKDLGLGGDFTDRTPLVIIGKDEFDNAVQSRYHELNLPREMLRRVGVVQIPAEGEVDRLGLFIGTVDGGTAIGMIKQGDIVEGRAQFSIRKVEELMPQHSLVVRGSRQRLIVNAL